MDSPRTRPLKQLHAARHAVEAHLIRGFLDSQGIAAEVRGDHLTSGWGELPVDVCSVWVLDDSQFEEANALLVDFLKGTLAHRLGGARWTCERCGEQLEGQFTACWSCGTPRPEHA
jgi:hypothetical protein